MVNYIISLEIVLTEFNRSLDTDDEIKHERYVRLIILDHPLMINDYIKFENLSMKISKIVHHLDNRVYVYGRESTGVTENYEACIKSMNIAIQKYNWKRSETE